MLQKLKSFLYNNEVRAILFQILAVVAIGYFSYQAFDNMQSNLESRGISSGFGFLTNEAGFDISETFFMEYTPESSNLEVFYVGLINTLLVAFAGIIFATILGLIVGISRLSNNFLISKMATIYIETLRNIPILLQILFWYGLALTTLKSPKESWSLFDNIFLNSRGLFLPKPILESGFNWVAIALVLGLIAFVVIKKYYNKQFLETNVSTNTIPHFLVLIFVIPLVIYFVSGATFDNPQLKLFNFKGGVSVSVEFFALVFALSTYTATYIAEAIRSGIEAVDKGQLEAAKSLGFSKSMALKLIILPQALKVAIPPIINQYLNLTKNSSLAAAIGYSEIITVFSGTVLNNVGQAIEIILLTMLVYLTISLFISFVLNIVNKKMQNKSR